MKFLLEEIIDFPTQNTNQQALNQNNILSNRRYANKANKELENQLQGFKETYPNVYLNLLNYLKRTKVDLTTRQGKNNFGVLWQMMTGTQPYSNRKIDGPDNASYNYLEGKGNYNIDSAISSMNQSDFSYTLYIIDTITHPEKLKKYLKNTDALKLKNIFNSPKEIKPAAEIKKIVDQASKNNEADYEKNSQQDSKFRFQNYSKRDIRNAIDTLLSDSSTIDAKLKDLLKDEKDKL